MQDKVLHILADSSIEWYGPWLDMLIHAQAERGYDTRLLSPKKWRRDERIVAIEKPDSQWHQELAAKQQAGLKDWYSPWLLELWQNPLFQGADIIHIHSGVNSCVSPLLVPFLSGKRVIWTMYQLPEGSVGEAEAYQRVRQYTLDNTECIPVAISKTLQQQIQCRQLFFNHEVQMIPPGIDELFVPARKASNDRMKLGIGQGNPVLLVAGGDSGENNLAFCQAYQELEEVPGRVWILMGEIANVLPERQGEIVRRLPQCEFLWLQQYALAADGAIILPGMDDLAVITIQASGCPVAVTEVNGDWILPGKSGKQITQLAPKAQWAEILALFSHSGEIIKNMGQDGRKQILEDLKIDDTLAAYDALYRQLLPGNAAASAVKVSGLIEEPELPSFGKIVEEYKMTRFLTLLQENNWDAFWQSFEEAYEGFEEKNAERYAFAETLCVLALKQVSLPEQANRVWETVDRWMKYRKISHRFSNLQGKDKAVHLEFCIVFRDVMRQLFMETSFEALFKLDSYQISQLLVLWRLIFVSTNSVLHMAAGKDTWWEQFCSEDMRQKAVVRDMLLASMYEPADKWNIHLEFGALLQAQLPVHAKMILVFWVTCIHTYNVTGEWQTRMLDNVKSFCQAAMNYPQYIPEGFFHAVVEHIGQHLWRSAYVGGNTVGTVSAYGDFLHFFMTRFAPQFATAAKREKSKKRKKKIRIGYVSHHFFSHAVPYYMMNRFIHHDRDKFEVYTFFLGARQDNVTEIIRQNSEKFITKDDLVPNPNFAKAIAESQLDILIYTDIGMDPDTYKLAALQLAPVQCALVGHGTTTGLPTIQYYISGDFEAPEAQAQYREKLIRLPNLGAAQYPPRKPTDPYLRSYFSLPEDAVVFVSCANGSKHGPERDRLLVEILQKAPNAWILLKPYMNWDVVDHMFTRRVEQIAAEAGVADRLCILSPLPRTSDVLGLLSVSDVQLDTYPYGGWTTNMEALYMGLPLVTQEGELARSRWGSHLLKSMGIQEGIAYNEREYVEWAVRFAQDDSLRKRTSDKIKATAIDTFFNGAKAQKAYEDVLTSIFRRHSK